MESLDFGNHSLIYDGLMILFHGRKLRGLPSVYERVAITGRRFADFYQEELLHYSEEFYQMDNSNFQTNQSVLIMEVSSFQRVLCYIVLLYMCIDFNGVELGPDDEALL